MVCALLRLGLPPAVGNADEALRHVSDRNFGSATALLSADLGPVSIFQAIVTGILRVQKGLRFRVARPKRGDVSLTRLEILWFAHASENGQRELGWIRRRITEIGQRIKAKTFENAGVQLDLP